MDRERRRLWHLGWCRHDAFRIELELENERRRGDRAAVDGEVSQRLARPWKARSHGLQLRLLVLVERGRGSSGETCAQEAANRLGAPAFGETLERSLVFQAFHVVDG